MILPAAREGESRIRLKDRLDPYLRGREGGGVIIVFIGTYFISMLPFAAAARYRVPVIPFLLLLGAYGVRTIAVFITRRRWVETGISVAGAGALYLLFSANPSGFQPAPEKWHYDRGLARLEAGH